MFRRKFAATTDIPSRRGTLYPSLRRSARHLSARSTPANHAARAGYTADTRGTNHTGHTARTRSTNRTGHTARIRATRQTGHTGTSRDTHDVSCTARTG